MFQSIMCHSGIESSVDALLKCFRRVPAPQN